MGNTKVGVNPELVDPSPNLTLAELVHRNSSAKYAFMAAVGAAVQEVPYENVVEITAAVPVPKTCIHTPQSVISMLLNNDLMTQTVYVDEVVYKGSICDLQNDRDVPDDAEIHCTLQSSNRAVKEREDLIPQAQIRRLFANRSRDVTTYLKLLNAVKDSGGLSRDQIEDLLIQDSKATRPDERTGLPTMYPAAYTTALEDAGAMVWSNGIWRVTETGKEVCEKNRWC